MQFIDESELLGALDPDKVTDSGRHGCYLDLRAMRLEDKADGNKYEAN
jgi:hypothetical protein